RGRAPPPVGAALHQPGRGGRGGRAPGGDRRMPCRPPPAEDGPKWPGARHVPHALGPSGANPDRVGAGDSPAMDDARLRVEDGIRRSLGNELFRQPHAGPGDRTGRLDRAELHRGLAHRPSPWAGEAHPPADARGGGGPAHRLRAEGDLGLPAARPGHPEPGPSASIAGGSGRAAPALGRLTGGVSHRPVLIGCCRSRALRTRIFSRMADKKIIAVFGATGAQGGGLARAIIADPEQRFSVRAVTRDASSAKARELSRLGAEVVVADIDDEQSIQRALHGTYGAFFITFFWDHLSPERETAEARSFAVAARASDVEHAIWSTLEDSRRWVPL